MNLLIMGPAGSGKGTMSEYIVSEYGIPHISTGDMLRENVKNQTELGKQAKILMDQGKLVSDDVVIGMVKARLQQDDCQKGFLMDGFPRTVKQAEALEEICNELNKPIQKVINLEVNFDALAERITGRRVCNNCKATYHIKNNKPKVEGVCDHCGSALVQRSDDTVEQLKVRLSEHEKNTKPALDMYASKGIVVNIDASVAPNEVWASIKDALGKAS
ncbi:MAG: adenylate kinase [Erysipelotrichaceae bacterium]|nr:adenylate kinase [Erysipelotrichaceae bacterium]MDY5251457.1 adenylate kinase [Erysipelotrichaceae bacterium]